jgi:uncharacterized membrane protein (UPF0127 family)
MIRGRRFEIAVLATEDERRRANLVLATRPHGRGALLLWPRERFLKLETTSLPEPSYDVVFLGRAGTVVDTGELDRENPEGLVPRVEAAAALLLTRGDLERARIRTGDVAAMDDLPPADDLPLMRIGGVEARVELPLTSDECRRGLMFRPRMSADDGMLFDNDREAPGLSAWMKNTLIPLDIAFFQEDGTLVNVNETETAADPRSGPWSLSSAAGPARFALEMNLGWFKRKGLVNAEGRVKPGTRAEFPAELRGSPRGSVGCEVA